MSRLVWGEPGKRLYETGIDRGVFYPREGVGVPWNGLLAVSEAPSGADLIENYYDGEKTIAQRNRESFNGQISALTVPREFEEYAGLIDGRDQQARRSFNFSYRTKVLNDSGDEGSYKIHLVYNAIVTLTSRQYTTLDADAQAMALTWDFATVPEFVPTGEAASHLIIDSSVAYPWVLDSIEDALYGSATNDSNMPGMLEVVAMFENSSLLRITDHGDGTWTADGPAEAIQMLSPTEFEITWPSAVYLSSDTYRISSL